MRDQPTPFVRNMYEPKHVTFHTTTRRGVFRLLRNFDFFKSFLKMNAVWSIVILFSFEMRPVELVDRPTQLRDAFRKIDGIKWEFFPY